MIKDADGREWVLVPVEATKEIALAMVNAPISGHPETGSPTVTDMWSEALAVAPQFVPPAVTDEAAHKLAEYVFSNLGDGRVCANDGRAMIAAVQQVLGPMIGLVPREVLK